MVINRPIAQKPRTVAKLCLMIRSPTSPPLSKVVSMEAQLREGNVVGMISSQPIPADRLCSPPPSSRVRRSGDAVAPTGEARLTS